MQHLSAGHRGKPAADQMGREWSNESKLDCGNAENIHRNGGDDSQENVSYIEN
jgi:hypothetical protein